MDRNPLGSVRRRLRQRSNAVATVSVVVIAVALMSVVLVAGARSDATTLVILGTIVVLVALGVAVVLRTRSAGAPGAAAEAVEGLTPEPIIDLDDLDLDNLGGARSRVEVALRPDALWRRRLIDRPDALVVAADDIGLDVPGWLVEGRSRMIEPTDRVIVAWTAIQRFRVRADRHGPDVYDITARADAGPPPRWRVRRDEITDEVRLLDHVRTVGRITIELEDSIHSV